MWRATMPRLERRAGIAGRVGGRIAAVVWTWLPGLRSAPQEVSAFAHAACNKIAIRSPALPPAGLQHTRQELNSRFLHDRSHVLSTRSDCHTVTHY